MTDPHNSHSSDNASSSNPRNSKEFINLEEEFALIELGLKLEKLLENREEPIPYIPKTGRWWIGHFAKFFGTDERNIKDRLKATDYEPAKFGNDLFIDAAKFWDRLDSQVIEDL